MQADMAFKHTPDRNPVDARTLHGAFHDALAEHQITHTFKFICQNSELFLDFLSVFVLNTKKYAIFAEKNIEESYLN